MSGIVCEARICQTCMKVLSPTKGGGGLVQFLWGGGVSTLHIMRLSGFGFQAGVGGGGFGEIWYKVSGIRSFNSGFKRFSGLLVRPVAKP